MSEAEAIFCSAALCAIAVKLLDDFLDRDSDAACGEPNWINKWGSGAVAYSLPLLAVAVALRPAVAISLFLAAWSVGMYHDFNVKYPSGLRGWQEAALATLGGCYFAGWQAMLCALLVTAAVQLLDDIIDKQQDRLAGTRNWANRLGNSQCCVLVAIFLLSAAHLAGTQFWPVAGGIATVYAAFALWGRILHD